MVPRKMTSSYSSTQALMVCSTRVQG
uniref:Protein AINTEGUMENTA n=1 Tax=Rhizophora mucronata TaxID=61149 RepID=A0A2P2MS23_RHIMU